MHLSNMHFFYDADGKPCQVNRGGTIYNYVLNVQGDVVGLTDASGNLVVEYKYDAWGKLLGISGSLATSLGTANPLRYRGYVYDNETGLYYLHSRYYDPEIRRFISADVIIGAYGKLVSLNVYCYCKNNSINRNDFNGCDGIWIYEASQNNIIIDAFSQLELITRLKHTMNGVDSALVYLFVYDDILSKVACKYDVEKEMMQAVLFREMICVGYDDIIADYAYLLMGRKCSTGIAQIRPSTVMDAMTNIYGECNKSYDEIWHEMQDPYKAIDYLGLVLKNIAMHNDIDLTNGLMGLTMTGLIFARYNGTTVNENTARYGKAVYSYYKAFRHINALCNLLR